MRTRTEPRLVTRNWYVGLTIEADVTTDLRQLRSFGQTIDPSDIDQILGHYPQYDDQTVTWEDAEYGYLHLEGKCDHPRGEGCADTNDDEEFVNECSGDWRRVQQVTFFGEVTSEELGQLIIMAGITDSIVNTMGMITGGGIMPAVALEQDQDQFAIVSLYVTPLETETEHRTIEFAQALNNLARREGMRPLFGLGLPMNDEYDMPAEMITDLLALCHETAVTDPEEWEDE